MEQRYAGVTQAAKFYGLAPFTLAQHARRGLIPGAFQFGPRGSWRIPLIDPESDGARGATRALVGIHAEDGGGDASEA